MNSDGEYLTGLWFENSRDTLKHNLDCKEKELPIEQLALGYVIANPCVKGNLIGVDNCEQLINNISVSKKQLNRGDIDFIKSISIKEKELLSPVNWN